MRVVIADDITGAAEMAGIASSRGLRVEFLLHTCAAIATHVSSNYYTRVQQNDALLVIATDTRSLSNSEAEKELRCLMDRLPKDLGPHQVFKKTDSALRGHVVSELRLLMQATQATQAIYLPANPSKGRTIKDGIYRIDGTPISETAFSRDPEFPATSSLLAERFPDAERTGILMPDAESEADVRNVVATAPAGTLFAGAADLFSVWLEPRKAPSVIIVCGSTQSQPPALDIAEAPMPREIYDGATDISLWDTSYYERNHSLMLTIPHQHRTGHDVAVHLREMTARQVQRLVAIHRPDQLIIEGGATAFSILQMLGWQQLQVERQLAPGVVQLRSAEGTLVTMKPGSYPWANNLFEQWRV